MLGLNRKKVKLVKYQTTWETSFKQEKQAIQEKLGNEVLAIEHIGSTSIPGMTAKPIIDFMVAVNSINDYEKYIAPLKGLGYEFRRDYRNTHQEHVLFVKGAEDCRTHYLKLTQMDSDFWQEHILFRDYLINHPDLANEYQKLKEKLGKEYSSERAKYTESKAEFIKNIIKLANKSYNN
jgi:GrpB-like predicted nucleotidyltransferase (UPF0157 family)